METVTLDRKTAEDLVNTKISLLVERINKILRKWNYDDVDKLLEDARTGKIEEAEMDAISLTNLIDQRKNLYSLKRQWNRE